MLKIGEIKSGECVNVSKNSANEHILLTGVSGTGKSTRLHEIIESARDGGETVIVFDINGTDYCQNQEVANLISIDQNGIALPVFKVSDDNRQYLRTLTETVDLFASVGNLGVRQQAAIREAIVFAMQNCENFRDEMRAIEVGLLQQKSNVADGVLTRLWSLLKGGFFNPNGSEIEGQKLNVISLEGLDSITQRQLIEIILRLLWRDCRRCASISQKKRIVIDEFQNLNLSNSSVLMEMMREARKYNVGIILATQSIASFSKEILTAINQTAVQLYFRPSPSEIKKVAEYIEPNRGYRWAQVLKGLRIGESIVNGDFEIGGHEFSKPIIIRSSYDTI